MSLAYPRTSHGGAENIYRRKVDGDGWGGNPTNSSYPATLLAQLLTDLVVQEASLEGKRMKSALILKLWQVVRATLRMAERRTNETKNMRVDITPV